MFKKTTAITIMLMLCFMTCICSAESDFGFESTFEKDKIIDVNINILEADWEDILTYSVNEEYHSADISINGTMVENIGIRTKGDFSLSYISERHSERYSFRVKFDKYVKNQSYLGLDEICLNNVFMDPSYMREYLHYEVLRKMGVTVPKTVFTNVYVNNKLLGFYLCVEAIDDTFLEDNFGKNYKKGNLYKMDLGSTLEYRDDGNYFYAKLNVGDDEELKKFKNFVKILNQMPDNEKGDIEKILDVNSALIYIATNTVMSNYDSYNGNMHHNFYLYEDPNGIFHVIPWDFNQSFGGFNGVLETVGIDAPTMTGSIEQLPLIRNLLEVPEYKAKYYSYIKDCMSYFENFENRVAELKEIISPYVKNDPSSLYTFEKFQNATSPDIVASDSAQIPIIECTKKRISNLKEQFAGNASKLTDRTRNFRSYTKRLSLLGNPSNDSKKVVEPSKIRINLNGHILSFDSQPIIKNNRLLVPFRAILEAMQIEVNYDNLSGIITASGNENEVHLSINSETAYVNGKEIKIDCAPIIKNDRTFIPARFIAEAFNMKVDWDETTNLVTITRKKEQIPLRVSF